MGSQFIGGVLVSVVGGVVGFAIGGAICGDELVCFGAALLGALVGIFIGGFVGVIVTHLIVTRGPKPPKQRSGVVWSHQEDQLLQTDTDWQQGMPRRPTEEQLEAMVREKARRGEEKGLGAQERW